MVSACTSSGPETSPGELQRVAKTGGGLIPCDQTKPWCGFDVIYQDTALTAISKTATAMNHGTLTAAAKSELDGIISSIPLATPPEEITGCADAPVVTMSIDFEKVGPITFRRACAFDALDDLGAFLNDVHAALIPTCTGNARVTCP